MIHVEELSFNFELSTCDFDILWISIHNYKIMCLDFFKIMHGKNTIYFVINNVKARNNAEPRRCDKFQSKSIVSNG